MNILRKETRKFRNVISTFNTTKYPVSFNKSYFSTKDISQFEKCKVFVKDINYKQYDKKHMEELSDINNKKELTDINLNLQKLNENLLSLHKKNDYGNEISIINNDLIKNNTEFLDRIDYQVNDIKHFVFYTWLLSLSSTLGQVS